MSDPDRLAYLYKEYVRIADRVSALVDGSFEDFRLLAAIGVLLGWPPLAASFNNTSSGAVLLFGVLAMLFVVAALLMRDILKQSIIRFSIDQVRRLEAEIQSELGPSESGVFQSAESWARWERRWYRPLLSRYGALFGLILLAFPDFVLATEGEGWHVAVYSGTFILVAAIIASATQQLNESVRAAEGPGEQGEGRSEHA